LLSTEPFAIEEPIDPNDANDPMLRVEANDPTEPMDRTEPLDPMDRIELVDHNDHVEESFALPLTRPSSPTLDGRCHDGPAGGLIACRRTASASG
jgi:hypothetical protein